MTGSSHRWLMPSSRDDRLGGPMISSDRPSAVSRRQRALLEGGDLLQGKGPDVPTVS